MQYVCAKQGNKKIVDSQLQTNILFCSSVDAEFPSANSPTGKSASAPDFVFMHEHVLGGDR